VDALADEDGSMISNQVDLENILFKTFFTSEHLSECSFDESFNDDISVHYDNIIYADTGNVNPITDELNSPVSDEELSFAITRYRKKRSSTYG